MKSIGSACLCVTFTWCALAGTLSVPFWLDDSSDSWTDGFPSDENQTATFIGVRNNTGAPLTITVTYADPDATDRTPFANTFTLQPGQGVSYRPVIDDTIQEDAAARAVPNKNGGLPRGSSRYTWVGADSDVSVRVYEKHGARTVCMSTITR